MSTFPFILSDDVSIMLYCHVQLQFMEYRLMLIALHKTLQTSSLRVLENVDSYFQIIQFSSLVPQGVLANYIVRLSELNSHNS